MSKLYKKYEILKSIAPSKIYLFECGLFYIFIHDDAKLMANFLNLKLTPLNSTIMKCGFPTNSSNRYLNILKSSQYNIEVVPSDDCYPYTSNINNFIHTQTLHNIINDFLNVNIDQLSISQAFDLLENLQNNLKFLGVNNETKK